MVTVAIFFCLPILQSARFLVVFCLGLSHKLEAPCGGVKTRCRWESVFWSAKITISALPPQVNGLINLVQVCRELRRAGVLYGLPWSKIFLLEQMQNLECEGARSDE